MRTIATTAILVPLLVTSAQAAGPEISKLQEGDVLVGATAAVVRSDVMRVAQGSVMAEVLVAPHVTVGAGLLAGWSSFRFGPTESRVFGGSARVSFPFGLSSWVSAAPYVQLDVTKGTSESIYTGGDSVMASSNTQTATVGLALIGLVSEHVFVRLDLAMLSMNRLSYDGVTNTGVGGRLGSTNGGAVGGFGLLGGTGLGVGLRL
ncbi:MAG: hypothetical protein JNL79_17215 [Myxococcales bacterium]|nr:hypothetical protein [Myxococcales bacterium]